MMASRLQLKTGYLHMKLLVHADYDGPRAGDVTNIVGMEEFHAGKAKTISGIEVVSDKVLKITYIEATPSLITGGIWTYPLAKHIFGDMACERYLIFSGSTSETNWFWSI